MFTYRRSDDDEITHVDYEKYRVVAWLTGKVVGGGAAFSPAPRRRRGLCQNTRRPKQCEVQGKVDGSKEGLEEGTLLKVGWLEGDEEGFAEILGDPSDARSKAR